MLRANTRSSVGFGRKQNLRQSRKCRTFPGAVNTSGRERGSRVGQRKETNRRAFLTTASVLPMGISRAGMALCRCPTLGGGGWPFISL